MIFDVPFEYSINDFEQFVVNHEFKTSTIGLYIFEDHKGNACYLLQDLAHALDDSQLYHRDELLDSLSDERKHPDIK